MLGVLLSIVLQGQDFPSPPFIHEWTYVFDESFGYGEVPEVVGDVAYLTTGGALVAFDLTAREQKWSWKPGEEEYVRGFGIDGGTVYVASQKGWPVPTGRLTAIDRGTGELQWSIDKSGDAGPVTVANGVIYTMMTPKEIWAIDLKTKEPIWKVDLMTDKASERRGVELERAPVVARGRVFIATGESKSFALDSATGEELWRVDESYSFGQTPLVHDGVVVVSSSRGATAKDVESGKDLWAQPIRFSDFAGVFDDNFVFLASGRIIAVAPRTGDIVWQDPIGEEGTSGGSRYGFATEETLIVRTNIETVAYGKGGKRLWTRPEGQGLLRPIWHDGEKFVCAGYMRLLGYVPGFYAQLPTDTASKTALAKNLAKDFELLDETELDRLRKLGREAVLPLADEMVRQGLLYERYSDDEELDSYRFYSVVMDIARLMSQIFDGEDTLGLVERAAALHEENLAKEQLLSLIASFGDAELAAPHFLKQFEGVPVSEISLEGDMGSPLQTIASSSLPEAVEFMISLLQDENADSYVRELAYVNLARVGGERGLKAVLAERIGRRLLPDLETRMRLDQAGESENRYSEPVVLDEWMDAGGRFWGLLRSSVLGSRGDLWLAEKVGGKWTRPLYTGVSLDGISRWTKGDRSDPTFEGYSAKALAEGDWFDVLVGSKSLRVDTDGDGLTDIMEKRLGSDPRKADTDGDGTPDMTDPWPDTKPHALNDEEAFYSAVFEARYHFPEARGPALFSPPDGLEPFEMPGWNGPVLWRKENESPERLQPLLDCYEQGAGRISFHEVREFDDDSPPTGQTITWNEDRTEGTVIISTYYGGLNGTGYFVRARKFGNQWVVIEMYMQYIS